MSFVHDEFESADKTTLKKLRNSGGGMSFIGVKRYQLYPFSSCEEQSRHTWEEHWFCTIKKVIDYIMLWGLNELFWKV